MMDDKRLEIIRYWCNDSLTSEQMHYDTNDIAWWIYTHWNCLKAIMEGKMYYTGNAVKHTWHKVPLTKEQIAKMKEKWPQVSEWDIDA